MSLIKTSQHLAISAGRSLTKQFKGFNIRVRDADGYIHATDMCKVGKKEWSGYIRGKSTKEFIKELESVLQIPTSLLIQSNSTGKYENRGTWVHPHIAINLAQWVSPIFAVKVAGWVSRFISGDLSLAKEVLETHDTENNTRTSFESKVNPETNERLVIMESVSKEEPKDELEQYDEQMKFDAFKHKYDRLRGLLNKNKIVIKQKECKISQLSLEIRNQSRQIQELLGYAKDTKTILGNVNEHAIKLDKRLDIVLPNKVDLEKVPDNEAPQVWIMRDKAAESDELNLYVIRSQLKGMTSAIKKLKRTYGDEIVTSYKIKQPNAVIFWNTIKKKYSTNIIKDPKNNWFKLDGITRKNFFRNINQMDNVRTKKV